MAEDTNLGLLNDGWIWHRVRAATKEVMDDLRSQGLVPVAPDDATRETFYSAAGYLAAVPDLEAELIRHVREVTPLAADFGYDISHSEPRWPTTIFVSAPSTTERYSALRLLENIIHEGMHLRLTSIERLHPLVRPDADRLFSPWKGQDRDTQGVLHGLYVFTCIAAIFAKPQLLACLDSNGIIYASRRIVEIKEELEYVNLEILYQNLTDVGRSFLENILTLDNESSPWLFQRCEENNDFEVLTCKA